VYSDGLVPSCISVHVKEGPKVHSPDDAYLPLHWPKDKLVATVELISPKKWRHSTLATEWRALHKIHSTGK
jgi:hypothetical protein